MFFLHLLSFLKINFKKIYISGINSLDPDQAQRFVRPDLGQNCNGFQNLSSADESSQL